MSDRAKSRLGNIKTLADKKPPRAADGPGGRKVAPPGTKVAPPGSGTADPAPRRLPALAAREPAADERAADPAETAPPPVERQRPVAATPPDRPVAAPPAPSPDAVRATEQLARQRQEAASARKAMKGFRVARRTAEEFAEVVGSGSQSREIRLAIKEHLPTVVNELAAAQAPELFADFEPVLESQRRPADEVRLTVYLTGAEAQALEQMTASVPDRSVAKVLEEAVIRRTDVLRQQTVDA